MKKQILSTLLAFGCSTLGLAEVPNTFSAGSPARASEVNENFSNLDTRTSNLELDVDNLRLDINSLLSTAATTISCSSDSSALLNAIDAGYSDITITDGTCDAEVRIDGRVLDIDGSEVAALDTSTGYFVAASSSALTLDNIDILGGVVSTTGSQVYLDTVDITCSGLYASSLTLASAYTYFKNVSTSGCISVYAESGTVFLDGNISLNPAADSTAVYLYSTSNFESQSTATLTINAENSLTDSSVVKIWDSSTISLKGTNTIEGSLYAFGNSHLSISNMTWTNAAGWNDEIVVKNNSSFRLNGTTFSNKLLSVGINSSARIFGLGTGSNNRIEVYSNSSILMNAPFIGSGNEYAAWQNSTIHYDDDDSTVLTLTGQVWSERNSIVQLDNPNASVTATCSVDGTSYVILNGVDQSCL